MLFSSVRRRQRSPLFPYTTLFRSPATGGANVALIGLLAHHRPEEDLVLARIIGQGFDMGRPSILERSEEHTSELQSHRDIVCRLLDVKKKIIAALLAEVALDMLVH